RGRDPRVRGQGRRDGEVRDDRGPLRGVARAAGRRRQPAVRPGEEVRASVMRLYAPLPTPCPGNTTTPSVGGSVFTPEGWDNVARGEALGTRSQQPPSLKGWDKPPVAALQAAFQSGPATRGVAPGSELPPLRGEEVINPPDAPRGAVAPRPQWGRRFTPVAVLGLLFFTTAAP